MVKIILKVRKKYKFINLELLGNVKKTLIFNYYTIVCFFMLAIGCCVHLRIYFIIDYSLYYLSIWENEQLSEHNDGEDEDKDSTIGQPRGWKILHNRKICERSFWWDSQRTRSIIKPTVGIDFLVKNVSYHTKNYRLQLWDTAGQERFRSLIPNYLKDAKCALIVIDVTSKASLNSTESWLKLYNDNRTG